MKLNRLILGLVLLGTLANAMPVAAVELSAFEEGNRLYEQRKYNNALAKYSDIVDSGQSSASLYYNMGNCYYRLGNKAQAIWAYQKALERDPRDADIRWNLGLVRKQTADKKAAKFDALELARVRDAIGRLKTSEIEIAFAGSVVLLALSFVLFAFVPALRPVLIKAAGVLLLLLALSGTVAALRWTELRVEHAVVRDKEIYARYEPVESATKAFLLHEGAEVQILKQSGEWCFVTFDESQRGWLPQSALLRL